ncbi:MAG: hypothetical protein QOF58_1472 [Pseudonocardiales bacterium]|nr:hypothetical protein [Pseudonocardiales bacterium]
MCPRPRIQASPDPARRGSDRRRGNPPRPRPCRRLRMPSPRGAVTQRQACGEERRGGGFAVSGGEVLERFSPGRSPRPLPSVPQRIRGRHARRTAPHAGRTRPAAHPAAGEPPRPCRAPEAASRDPRPGTPRCAPADGGSGTCRWRPVARGRVPRADPARRARTPRLSPPSRQANRHRNRRPPPLRRRARRPVPAGSTRTARRERRVDRHRDRPVGVQRRHGALLGPHQGFQVERVSRAGKEDLLPPGTTELRRHEPFGARGSTP